MLKCAVTYVDFNGKTHSEDLWFHVSKTNILMSKDDTYTQILTMGKVLQEKAKVVEAIEKRNAEDANRANIDPKDIYADSTAYEDTLIIADTVRIMAQLLDKLVCMSYGKRSEDGSRFIKNEETLRDWKESMAYDAFIEKMMSNTTEMTSFIENLMK